jgi:Tol biopolymer transport system component
VARLPRRPREPAPAQVGVRRLPFSPGPVLSGVGLVLVAAVTFALLGGSLPGLPGTGNGDGGPIRTPTPSNVVVIDPRGDVPGSLLYVKEGNLWLQNGDQVRQLTSEGEDFMPTWSPDGSGIYYVHTVRGTGEWLTGGEVRTYNLTTPRLVRVNADGTGEPEGFLNGRVKQGPYTWSFFIRDPSISPDGTRAAIVTDGPDPTTSDVVVKILDLTTKKLSDPDLPENQGLGHASPAWSPDGRFLLYVRNAREGTRGTPAIFRYNLANGRSAALTGGGYASPAWSRDGRYVAATKTGSFGTDIVVLDARNGAELLRLTDDERSFSPVWSPKGDAIAFYRVEHGVVDLYLIPLGGTAPNWEVGKPLALTISAGLDGSSRPAWFIPADQLPPLPTETPAASGASVGGSGTP